MADDGSTQSSATWPLPKFHCRVTVDGVSASVSEVSGLEMVPMLGRKHWR
jgi:hypothetical protein